MAYFTTGKATLNEHLVILNGDKNFFHYIAWENSMYLEQSVFPVDYPEVKKICEQVMETGERMLVSYRVYRPDETKHWVIASVERKELSGENVICFNIQAIDDLEQEISEMHDTLNEINTYMDILDEFFFRYDVEADDMCLFMGGEKQRVVLFSGSLDDWAHSLERKKSFDDEKVRDGFDSICQDLQQGSRHFSREVMLPNLTHGDEKEFYLFKGRSVVTDEGRSIVLGCVCTISKNSRRRKTRLGAEAVRDEMTGLLSKQTIIEYVQNALAAKPDYTCYLCILDVDNFKYVNDTFGHMFGDQVLITVADILKDSVGDRGVVGRIGGDEMLIFLENIADKADLKGILRMVRSNVEWAYRGVKDDLNLSCSIGCAGFPANGNDYETLFRIADKMLYRAKENGKNRYIIYTPSIHGDVLGMNSGEEELVSVPNKVATNKTKEQLLMELSEQFIYRLVWPVYMAIEETGVVFGLKGIDVFYDEPVYVPIHWRADGSTSDDKYLMCAGTVQFRQLFDNNGLAVINNYATLQFSCPDMYEYFKERRITGALIYRMDRGVKGYVVFFREDAASRMWSEADRVSLNIIGKMIALILGGK